MLTPTTFVKNIIRDPKLYQYTLVGGFSAIVDISLFLLLKAWVSNIHYLLIATFTFILATFVNYFLCMLFVFKHDYKRSSQQRLFLVYVVSAIGLLIHHSVLFFTFEALTIPIAMSKILAMGTAFGWNFLSRKHFVFA